MKIAVAGTGYVGLSLATLLSQKHEVYALDVIPEKVEKINNRISPIQDEYIEKYFEQKELNLTATLDYKEGFTGARFVIISTPTNYDEKTHFFDTSSVEDIIVKVKEMNDPNMIMVVKSTIPVGFIDNDYEEGMEKYYTVNDEKNNRLAEQYRELAKNEPNVIFGGRLAEYKYYDMDDVIKSAFEVIIED